jgi:hypothetical protein
MAHPVIHSVGVYTTIVVSLAIIEFFTGVPDRGKQGTKPHSHFISMMKDEPMRIVK